MNTQVVATGLIALIGGVALGSVVFTQNNESPAMNEVRYQENYRPESRDVLSADFVSVRPAISSLPTETLSQSEIDGLVFTREEEKLARDVYQTLYEKWGLQIFANIAQSEQTHTEAVRDLLSKYNLTDPVTEDTIGVFTNPELQKLYNDLVSQGKESEVSALIVGATIEDLDIKDLAELTSATDNEDILLVYDNLTRGSRNHMRAFTRQLSTRGESYEAQYISSEDYESITSSQQETGRQQSGGGTGHGGRGWGNKSGQQ